MQLLTDTEGKKYWKLSQKEFARINKVLYEAAKVKAGWGTDEAEDYFYELAEIGGREYANKVRGLIINSWHSVPRRYCEKMIIKYLSTEAREAFKKLYRKNSRFASLLKSLHERKLIGVEDGGLVLSDELSKRTLLTLYSDMPTDTYEGKNNSWKLIDFLFDFKYPCKALTSHLGYSKKFLKKYGRGKLISWFD